MAEPPADAIPQIPGGPPAGEPIPTTPVEGFDLVAYTRLSVRLARPGASRDALLAAAGLDALTWLEIEKTWLLRIAAGALRNDPTLAREYEAAEAEARAALSAERG